MSAAFAGPAEIGGLIAVALLALAALAVHGFLLGYPRPPLPTRVLSAKEQAILAACADALFPPGGPIPLSGTEAGLVPYIERLVARSPRPTRVLLRLLFQFVEHAPWIFGPRRARFTRLEADERREALERMARSPIYFRRVAFLSLRTLLTMGYLANDEVLRTIGIPCPPPPEDPSTAAPPGLDGGPPSAPAAAPAGARP